MNVPRESISLALFNLLQNYAALKAVVTTFTRVPRFWDQVPEGQKPMLMLFKGGPSTEEVQQPQNSRIALSKYVINYNLWLLMTATPGTVAETTINAVADGIDGALQLPQVKNGVSYGGQFERQTLGGLVNNCFVSGGVEWAREFEDNNIVCMWRIQIETGQ